MTAIADDPTSSQPEPLSPEDVARAISGHRFDAAAPYIAADIQWTIIGGEPLLGRDAVLTATRAMAEHIATVTTDFHRFDVLVGDGFVVVDTLTDYLEGGETTTVASCDIYRFIDGQVVAITSYMVDVA